MSNAENPTLTTARFIESWRTQDPQRLAAELVSVHKETNRQTDTYHFEVENGLLIDPETKRPVLSFITPGVEYDIAEKLQSWAADNEEGLAYWVSPRLKNNYPCEKAIVHRLAYTPDGKKVVMNSAILFNADLENPEDLRRTLFTTEDTEENLFGILSWVEEKANRKIDTNPEGEEIKNYALYFADQIVAGVPEDFIVSEMQRTGFLGQNPVSCPGGQTFSQFIDSNSSTHILTGAEDHMGSLEFVCPNGHRNTRPYGQKIPKCLTCGVSVDC